MNKFLILIIIIVSFVNLYRLADFPVYFSRDEASVAYNAYSILKTGKDEWGASFPVHFKGPGDYPPGFAFYITIPFIAVFGLNEWSARLPAAIFGILNVVVTYVFVKQISNRKSLALLTGLAVALSPLHIVNARSGSEVIFAYFFTMLTLIYYLKKRWFLSVIFATLGLLSYLSTRIFLPLMLLSVLFVLVRHKTRGYIVTIMVIIGIALGLTVFGHGQIRFQGVSIFNQPITNNLSVLSEQDALSSEPYLFTRIIHNRYVYTLKTFIVNYFEYLSSNYLFSSGGFPTRFKVTETGILFFIEAPLLIYGFLISYRQYHKLWKFCLLFLLLSILPAAITTEYSPNVRRAFFMLFPLSFWVACGLEAIYYQLKTISTRYHLRPVIFIVPIALLCLINVVYFADQFIAHNQFAFAMRRNQDFRFFINQLHQLEPQYEHIYFTSVSDNPYIYLAFYNRLDPKFLQDLAGVRPANFANQEWSLGKITFVTEDCPHQLSANSLYVGKGDVCTKDPQIGPTIDVLQRFSSPGTPIYDLYIDKPLPKSI
jgi:4-amino-4-deoxy-L-arabinose transferase-like glycosyltransferase